MKRENVVRGVRVELKSPCSTKDTLPVGTHGTLLESKDAMPYVEWDNFNYGHSTCNPTVPDSCWAVSIKQLRRIKD